ncbi:MAG: T9SS type A sorting domain-containing protein [Chitinophagaceae bacterium]|nr:T9SS type A sorting domain-containing protein [Chitinophagaceae bacterium]
MRFFYFFFFLSFFISAAFSQRKCGTYNYAQTQPAYSNNQQSANSATTSEGITRDTLNNEVIIIPVVIHILYSNTIQNISDAQALSQLAVLNNDYRKMNGDAANVPAAFKQFAADARIVFCLSKTDPKGRSTKGIIHKYTTQNRWQANDAIKFSASGGDDAWDAKKYLNIWVGNLSESTLGYASVPGADAERDGVVIQYDVFGNTGNVRSPFNKGRTATHEIGHWLGLKHLWGDALCGDDGISDTPPQKTYNTGCSSFPHLSTCSVNANGDMFMDFMDFSDDACMYMFTTGQKNKMRSLFATGGERNSFLTSTGCDSSRPEAGPSLQDSLVKQYTGITIFPNPSSRILNVGNNTSVVMAGKTALIFNMTGIRILSQQMVSGNNIIHIETLASGVYILKIGAGKDQQIIKFIKQ